MTRLAWTKDQRSGTPRDQRRAATSLEKLPCSSGKAAEAVGRDGQMRIVRGVACGTDGTDASLPFRMAMAQMAQLYDTAFP